MLNFEVIVPKDVLTSCCQINLQIAESCQRGESDQRRNLSAKLYSTLTRDVMSSPKTMTPSGYLSTCSNIMASHNTIQEEQVDETLRHDRFPSTAHLPLECPTIGPHPTIFQPTTAIYTNNDALPLRLSSSIPVPAITTTATPSCPTLLGNRFKNAQRDRTLRHHKLIQPTTSQERVHLASLRAERQIEYDRRSSSCLSLLSLPEETEEEETHPEEGNQGNERICTMQNEEEEESDMRLDHLENISLTIKNLKLSRTSSIGNSSFCFNESDRSTASIISVEDDINSNASPDTALYVPGEASILPISIKHTHNKLRHYDHVASDLDTIEDDAPTNTSDFANSVNCNIIQSHLYCQPCEMEPHSSSHRFIVCADTQFGITKNNRNWDAEVEYSRQAVDLINSMNPLPSFVCVCGDLVDMEFSFEKKKGSKSKFPSTLFNGSTGIASREVCDAIQDEQNEDFQKIWAKLHPDIALVCLCGNHDVGNRPTPRSIARFRAAYGDEYLAFWVNGTYNIVLNNVLFIDPSGAKRIYNAQLRWLEDRLKYAQDHQAKQVFVFAHHPWFLYDEEEDPESLTGASPYPKEWKSTPKKNAPNDDIPSFPDSYFSMPKRYRFHALDLFRKYSVTACFSGHFHQNLLSKTTWGMDMIITAPLSVVFESSGKEDYQEKKMEAMIEMEKHRRRRKMTYESEKVMLNGSGHGVNSITSGGGKESPVEEEEEEEEFSPPLKLLEPNCRGIRVVEVQVNETSMSTFSHWFVPL